MQKVEKMKVNTKSSYINTEKIQIVQNNTIEAD